MGQSRVRQLTACADRHRFRCLEGDTAWVRKVVHAMQSKTAPRPRSDRGAEIADLHEAGSSGLRDPARIHVIAKDTNTKAVVANETVE